MKREDQYTALFIIIFNLTFIMPLSYIEIVGLESPAHFFKPVNAAKAARRSIMASKTQQTAAPQYLKKVTTKHVRLSTKQMEEIAEAAMKKAGEPVDVAVMRVYGRARTATQGQGTYGPWTKFGGEFEAVNLVTKEVFRSTHLCLPPMGEQMLSDMLESREDKDAWVQFGVDVTVAFNDSAKGGTKFSYGVQPLMETTQPKDDILTQLGAKLPKPKALLP